MTFVTLIADASVGADGCAGYACYIAGADKRPYYTGGALGVMASSNAAELAAIRHGVESAAQYNGWTSLLAQSDNLRALQVLLVAGGGLSAKVHPGMDAAELLRPKAAVLTPFEKDCAVAIRSILGERLLWLRHVYGHGNGSTARGYVNTKCDTIARSYMRKSQLDARKR